jgi:methylmalonyl-CoA mutase N-terminal domain/subunit
MRDHYQASDPRSLQLRFHTQTAGVSLTAQQPEVNIVRTAIEALAGVLGGTQSLHTNSMDEALALPTEKAARIALRTQQVLAFESNVANVADPLGGSYFVEALTTEMDRQAELIFSEIAAMGAGSMLEGVIAGIESNYFQGAIADSSYELERSFNAGTRVVVGANRFLEGNEDTDLETLLITQSDEKLQVERVREVRRNRDGEAVRRSLARLATEAADPEINLMPALIEAAQNYVTVGESMATLAQVFGRYVETASI